MYKFGKNDWYLSGLNSQKFFATTKTQPLYHRGTLLLSLRDHENETKLFTDRPDRTRPTDHSRLSESDPTTHSQHRVPESGISNFELLD
uniref:Uncharacterized protein n=1 Tax=Pristionchus pacificus TaxID=54126 RepID=A0A8R1YWX2_PRIPA